jgi:asparagine synthase (glutamine-hydrolysing)
MSQMISHRGYYDSGLWLEDESQVVLANRRLSIQNLSTAGHQPMLSASGRFVIVFNGEIYNYLQLQAELKMVGGDGAPSGAWRSHSDIETLLAGIERWRTDDGSSCW